MLASHAAGFVLVQKRLGSVVIRTVFIVFLLAMIISAYRANSFADLWFTPDQQGDLAYNKGDFESAARKYDTSFNKGLSYYAAGDFYNAIYSLQSLNTSEALFFAGNAYAQAELLEESIAAYNQALALDPSFSAAQFNLKWVSGIKELNDRQFDDAGGTDGKLESDGFIIDNEATSATAEMSLQEMQAQGLSNEQLQELWMRRVQTTPGDFLSYKFAYQAQKAVER